MGVFISDTEKSNDAISMISVIKKMLSQAVAVTNCCEALQRDDVDSAKRWYSEFADSTRPRHVALGGRIKLAERDIAGAQKSFEKVVDLASGKKSKRDRYVVAYCRFYLSLMNKDGQHENHRNEALSLKPLKSLFYALPLAPKNRESEDKIPDPRSIF